MITVFLLGLAIGLLLGAIAGVWMKTSDEDRDAAAEREAWDRFSRNGVGGDR